MVPKNHPKSIKNQSKTVCKKVMNFDAQKLEKGSQKAPKKHPKTNQKRVQKYDRKTSAKTPYQPVP